MRIGPKGTTAAVALFVFVGVAVMIISPHEDIFLGNPDTGGPLEVQFGTPASRAIYTYWPESGIERLNVSSGIWDSFKIELFYLLEREGQVDLGEYDIRGQEITGHFFRRESFEGGGQEILERGFLVVVFPAKAQKALAEGRRKVRAHWPEELGVVSTSGSSLSPK